MRVGGNAACAEYFKKHGGSSLLSTKDAKIKYSSKQATQYKAEIKKRAELDAKQHPDFDFDEDVEEPTAEKEAEGDFFSSWDKPAIVKATPPPSRTASPHIIGTPAASQNAESPAAEPRPTVKTTNSSLRKSTTASTGGARRSGVSGAKKTSKLGAKKINVDIDFDEQERLAREEAELMAAEPVAAPSPPPATSVASPRPDATPTMQKETKSGKAAEARKEASVAPVQEGFARLGFGQTAVKKAATATPKKKAGGFGRTSTPVEETTEARDKYANQKSISSDQFFGRNDYDAAQQNEARERLGGFTGAQSISSNQYFGRPEEEDVGGNEGSELEATARAYIGKLQSMDVEQYKEALGTGIMKLGRYVDDLARNF